VPVRYMGTKRHLAPRVRSLIQSTGRDGRVADLFAGVGAVVASLADDTSVVANDLLAFTGCLARARFTPSRRRPLPKALQALTPQYRRCYRVLAAPYQDQLRAETTALEHSDWRQLAAYMADTPHVAMSGPALAKAAAAAHSTHRSRYQLATLYFAGSYFSTRQALQIDAIRCAIESQPSRDRDWLLSAWLAAAGVVMNSPGHSAQSLRCHDDESRSRVRRNWRRDVWTSFVDRLNVLQPVGTSAWRANNEVTCREARDLLKSRFRFTTVYADPPYTKDQYSRYYHVYETLYQYDFPASIGAGRYRDDRFVSDFSLKSKVEPAFRELCELTAARGSALILSYPSNGLLVATGVSPDELLHDYFPRVTVHSASMKHSTLGASSGYQTKAAMENLYVCIPD
jgi:adenine-specific DNA-methyltransferase